MKNNDSKFNQKPVPLIDVVVANARSLRLHGAPSLASATSRLTCRMATLPSTTLQVSA